MSFYRNHVYPYLVAALGNPEPIQKIRKRLIPEAHGKVLEIGVGPGVNFPHYDSQKVEKLYALDPNPSMVKRAEKERAQSRLNIEFLALRGERIPLEPASIDTVVSTFTLCTIPDVVAALQGVREVLKPEGKFIFFEHGLSPDASVRQWQKQTEPFFQWAFEGCHVTRDIPGLIREPGFEIERMDTGYLAPFPKCGSYCFWGIARPKL